MLNSVTKRVVSLLVWLVILVIVRESPELILLIICLASVAYFVRKVLTVDL